MFSWGEVYAVEFPFEKRSRIQSTAYYWIENSATDTFLEVFRNEKMFQENCPFYFNVTDLHSVKYPTSKKTDPKKIVFCECSARVAYSPGKGLLWSHFIKIRKLLFRTYMLLKKSLHKFKRFGKFSEKSLVLEFYLINSRCRIYHYSWSYLPLQLY